MFREFIEVNNVRETKKVESIFPKFFDDIQLDGAREIKEVYESKNSGNNPNEEDPIFPAFFKDIILK